MKSQGLSKYFILQVRKQAGACEWLAQGPTGSRGGVKCVHVSPGHQCSVMSLANHCGFTAVRASASISANSLLHFLSSAPLPHPLDWLASRRVAVFLFLHSLSWHSQLTLLEKPLLSMSPYPAHLLTSVCSFCHFSVTPIYSQEQCENLESKEGTYQTKTFLITWSCFWADCPQPMSLALFWDSDTERGWCDSGVEWCHA